jgi:hypothetical protein
MPRVSNRAELAALRREVAELKAAADRADRPDTSSLEADFYRFAVEAWPWVESSPYVDNWHISCLCDHLQAVAQKTIRNLLCNVPPGCSKSLLAAVLWPAWVWSWWPAARFFFASYDQRLSTRDSVSCRYLLASKWYRDRWGNKFRLVDDQNLKTNYQTTASGWRLATTVAGYGTGEHPDFVVVDDPQNPSGAESEADRQTLLDWWDMTMSTRGVSRGVSHVGIQQRLSVDDFSAHVLKGGDFRHVMFPMRFENDHQMEPSAVILNPGTRWERTKVWKDERTTEGHLLTPRLFPEEAVRTMERKLLAYGTAGQLQQRPFPKSGHLFKSEWWLNRCRFELTGARDAIVRLGVPGLVPLDSCMIFVIVDGAASSKETSDHTAMGVYAIDNESNLYLLWMLRLRLEVEDIVPTLDKLCAAWRPDWVGIEANGFQVWFPKIARLERGRYPHIPTIRELNPNKGGKESQGNIAGKGKAQRAAPAIIRAVQGQIWLPHSDDRDNPWIVEFEEELLQFSGKEGRPDDQIDTLAWAVLSCDYFGYRPQVESELPVPSGRRPRIWD